MPCHVSKKQAEQGKQSSQWAAVSFIRQDMRGWVQEDVRYPVAVLGRPGSAATRVQSVSHQPRF